MLDVGNGLSMFCSDDLLQQIVYITCQLQILCNRLMKHKLNYFIAFNNVVNKLSMNPSLLNKYRLM